MASMAEVCDGCDGAMAWLWLSFARRNVKNRRLLRLKQRPRRKLLTRQASPLTVANIFQSKREVRVSDTVATVKQISNFWTWIDQLHFENFEVTISQAGLLESMC